MPVWNGERFLRQAVWSIQAQTFEDFEFIIVDDGSTDGSVELARSFQDERFRIVSQANAGPSAARNRGVAEAKADLLAFFDADDIAYPERLREQVDFLDSHPDHILLGTGYEEIAADGSPLPRSGRPFYTEDADIRRYLLAACPFTQASVMMRRDAFTRTGGYRAFFDPAEDYDLWVRLAQLGKVANLQTILIRSRHHRNQISAKQLEKQMLADLAVKQLARRLAQGEADPFQNVAGPLQKTHLTALGLSDREIDLHVLDGFENWARRVWRDGDRQDSAAVLKRALDFARRSSLTRLECARYGFLLASCYLRQNQFGAALKTASNTLLSAPAYPFTWVAHRLTRRQEM